MIPYITWTTIPIGPLTLHVWGLFVALGFAAAAWAAGWLARRRGGDAQVVYDLAARMVVTGMVGGRLGHVILYEPAYYLAHPLEVFAVWEGGLSLFGGLLVSVVAGVWYLRVRRVDVWRYADAVAFGLPVGFAVGRIGCFLIHDHPGTAIDFALGVQYPDGVVRHDLGLYEVLNGVLLAALFAVMARKRVPVGWFLAVFAMEYGMFRVLTDGLRAVDSRYAGVTPGQYLGGVLVVVGVALAVWITRGTRGAGVLK